MMFIYAIYKSTSVTPVPRWQAPVVWLLEPVFGVFPSSFQTSNLTSHFFVI